MKTLKNFSIFLILLLMLIGVPQTTFADLNPTIEFVYDIKDVNNILEQVEIEGQPYEWTTTICNVEMGTVIVTYKPVEKPKPTGGI